MTTADFEQELRRELYRKAGEHLASAWAYVDAAIACIKEYAGDELPELQRLEQQAGRCRSLMRDQVTK